MRRIRSENVRIIPSRTCSHSKRRSWKCDSSLTLWEQLWEQLCDRFREPWWEWLFISICVVILNSSRRLGDINSSMPLQHLRPMISSSDYSPKEVRLESLTGDSAHATSTGVCKSVGTRLRCLNWLPLGKASLENRPKPQSCSCNIADRAFRRIDTLIVKYRHYGVRKEQQKTYDPGRRRDGEILSWCGCWLSDYQQMHRPFDVERKGRTFAWPIESLISLGWSWQGATNCGWYNVRRYKGFPWHCKHFRSYLSPFLYPATGWGSAEAHATAILDWRHLEKSGKIQVPSPPFQSISKFEPKAPQDEVTESILQKHYQFTEGPKGEVFWGFGTGNQFGRRCLLANVFPSG